MQANKATHKQTIEKEREALPGLHELAAQAFAHAADAPAIEFQQQWLCWGELAALAKQIRTLLDELDIAAGAKVALIARNHPAAIVAFVALIAARMNIRMIYPFQSAAGIAAALEDSSPAVVLALAEDFSDEVRATMQHSAIAAIGLQDLGARVIAVRKGSSVQAERETQVDGAAQHGSPENLSIEILTSGTTGKPKPFLISYDMIARDFIAANRQLGASPGDASQQEPVLLYFPVGNISGLYSTLPAILSGRRIVLLERFSVAAWHDFVLRYRPVISGMPPAGIQMLLDANIPQEDLSSIRMFGAGAAPLDPAVQKEFESRYGIPILLSYGATEFGGPVTRMTPEQYAQQGKDKIGSVGKAMPGVQLRVIDAQTDTVLAAGEEGILEVVSPRIGPHWIRTTDIAVIDTDGYVFIRGRADGAIIRGGFKILPETVEQALLQHPCVSAAAVVGIKDHRLGQVPAAAIVLKPGSQVVSEDDLKAFLREHLLATHIPTEWRFVDALPRTKLSYKVDQAAVRALFE